MVEEIKEKKEGEDKKVDGDEKAKGKVKSKRKWFKKIPKDIFFTPGGMVLAFFAVVMEILDALIPPSGIDSLVIELIPELFYCVLLNMIAGVSFTAMIIPLLVERITFISDVVPTWLIQLLL